MKVDELVKELRLRATHVPERQQFASHAMSHAADLLEAQAAVIDLQAQCVEWERGGVELTEALAHLAEVEAR